MMSGRKEHPRDRARRAYAAHPAVRAGMVLLLILMLVLGHVSLIGFPGFVTDRIRHHFEEAGYDLQFERLRFSFRDGIVAERIVFYADAADTVPALRARALALAFDLRAWIRRETGLERVRIVDGMIRLNTAGPLREEEDPHHIRFTNVRARLNIEPGGLRLERLEAEAPGLRIEGRGFVVREEMEPGVEPSPTFRMEILQDIFEQNRAWLPDLVAEINAVEFIETSEADIEFLISPARPEHNEIRLTARGGQTRLRGAPFDAWRIESRMRGHALGVENLSARFGDHRLEVSAGLDMDTQIVEARLHSSLPPLYWKNMIPVRLREAMEEARLFVDGAMEVDVRIGPVPILRAWEYVEGDVTASGVDLRGVWLERVRLTARSRTNQLYMTVHEGIVGRNEPRGTVRGVYETDLDALTYSGHMTGNFDPNLLVPVLDRAPGILRLVRSFSFREAPPLVIGDFSGAYRDPAQFSFEGTLGATNFLFRGSSVSAFEASMTIGNRLLRMDPMRVTRSEGGLSGVYEQQLDEKWVRLDVESEVDPKALIRLGEPELEVPLRPFRFEGPVHVTVQGFVGYGGHHDRTDYTAVARAQQVGWRWMLADSGSFTWRAKDDRVEISGMAMSLYGGTVTGTVNLAGIGMGEPAHYDVKGYARDVQFGEFIRHLRDADDEEYEGRIACSFHFRGRAGDDWRESIQGDGRLRIREGHVFQIPLLGGLSQILSRVYPGLGFAAQTDLRTDFEVDERRVQFEDLRIEGTVLSIRAWGYYDLNDTLNVRVQVQPLRRGFVVEAIRFVTFPVSRLLQLRLRGTLDQPQWRIEAIPREWMELFERGE